MTFRRSKDDAGKARVWRNFRLSQRQLFDEAGLPGVLSEDQDAFDYFLMHGYLPMPGGHADGTRFNASQRDRLDRLAALYVEQFGDPGISLGPRLVMTTGSRGQVLRSRNNARPDPNDHV
jgi:hypothetical protein